jgi:transposase
MQTEMQIVNPQAAGIDIGSDKFYVCVGLNSYRVFGTYHEDCEVLADYLQELAIKSVAFESTGVFWIHLKDVLDSRGFEICLANPRQTKQTKFNRKSDITDCQWIYQLHTYGLLQPSFFPESAIEEMRDLSRLREDHVRAKAQRENLMIKALTMMNVRIKETISSVTSVSGLAIIQAIVSGERDAEKLLALCHSSIIGKKGDRMLKALKGNFKPHYVLMLKQALEGWEFCSKQIKDCDQAIAELMEEYVKKKDLTDVQVTTKAKSSRTTNMPQIEGLHALLIKMTAGRDLTTIPFVSDYTAYKIVMELGTDLSKFPSVKHFVSWCGLAPKSKQSGKMKRNMKSPSTNVGQILREAVHAGLKSKHNSIGERGRRINARRGTSVAIKAMARMLAIEIYNTLVHGEMYVEQGVEKYKEKELLRKQKTLLRLAKELNIDISIDKDPLCA